MEIHTIIDLILIAVALCIIFRCWRQGLVASLVRLAGTLAAYVCAWVVSEPVSHQIYDQFIHNRLLDYAGTLLPENIRTFPPTLVEAAQMFPEIRQQLSDAINTAFADAGYAAGLPVKLVDTEKLGERVVGQLVDSGSGVAEALVEVIMEPAALTITRVVAFIIIFAAVSFLVAILFRMGKFVNYIPLVGCVNRLAGMGVGLLEAAITLYILALLLFMAGTLLGSQLSFLRAEVLERSAMLTWIMQWRLPAGFMMFDL